jgi:Uncharacterized conserved protein, contains FHA domain
VNATTRTKKKKKMIPTTTKATMSTTTTTATTIIAMFLLHMILVVLIPFASATCTDSTERFTLLGSGLVKSCAWAARKPSKTAVRCNRIPTREMCPETCQDPACSIPTASPTNSPPTVLPPSCQDDTTFIFRLDNSNLANCQWLTDNNPTKRIAKYCPRGHVKARCQRTCNFCSCLDDDQYRFTLIKTGRSRSCTWLTRSSKPVVDQRRISNYCFSDNGDDQFTTASAVGNACTASCGFCDPPTPSPTATPTIADSTPSSSPTRPPSPMPSPFPTLRPTSVPSDSPSERPSVDPSVAPSEMPSDEPSLMPSDEPSVEPSEMPSDEPSVTPSEMPSDEPSVTPSDMPSDEPSEIPSHEPSVLIP